MIRAGCYNADKVQAKRKRPELSLQKAVTQFLNLSLPKNVFWTAFPAGGGGKIRGVQLRASGLVAGVPDLLIISEGRAIFIELKAPKGRLSIAQHETALRLDAAGAPVYLCRSVEEVARDLVTQGIVLRGEIT